jgi:hypothetical protein
MRPLVLGLLLLPQVGCGGAPGCGKPGDSTPCTRVLFVGNSYTSVNDLPTMFANLASSGDHRVEAVMLADGGATLASHAASQLTTTTLTSGHWDIVVLQEQSQLPSIEKFRQEQMYPAARQLAGIVRGVGAKPMFFVTWARREGWRENGLADYTSMQSAIDDGYLTIARDETAAIAPVGFAWQTVVSRVASPGLWQDDGSHPTVKGTYLAACVFYAAIFREGSRGLRFHADLPDDEAARLQEIADSTVLGDPVKWGLT